MQIRHDHPFDRIEQRPARASQVGNDTSNDINPNSDTETTCTTAALTRASGNGFSERHDGTDSQIQLRGASGVTVETRRLRKSAMSRYAQDRHKRAARMLGYALTLDDPSTWNAASILFGVNLTLKERFSLIFVLLAELAPNDRMTIFAAFDDGQPDGAGKPIAPLFNLMDEATFGASLASPRERDAYILAIYVAMSPKRQANFRAQIAQGDA